MHGHKLLLAEPHVAQPTNVINLKSHESAHGCITLINIYVFKSANIAVLGVFWPPPDYYLG